MNDNCSIHLADIYTPRSPRAISRHDLDALAESRHLSSLPSVSAMKIEGGRLVLISTLYSRTNRLAFPPDKCPGRPDPQECHISASRQSFSDQVRNIAQTQHEVLQRSKILDATDDCSPTNVVPYGI